MAATNFSASNYFNTLDSANVSYSTSQLILMTCWLWPTTPSGAHDIFSLSFSSSGTNHYNLMMRNTSNKLIYRVRSDTSYLGDLASSNDLNYDAWNLCGLLAPVNNGASQTFYRYLNGTRTGSSATTANYTATLDTVYFGRFANGSLSGDKIAHAAIFTPTDLAAADAIMASLASTPPASVGGAGNVWELIDDANADVGGANLTTFGSPSFDASTPYGAPPASSFKPRVCIY